MVVEVVKFSIITPLNKIPDTFPECLKSLENQNSHFEWIIVLNGIDIIESEVREKVNHSSILEKIRFLKYSGPTGPSGPRNMGIKSSKGNYLIFLDSDDYISDDFLINLQDRISSIGSDTFVIASNGKRYKKYQSNLGKNNLIFSDKVLKGGEISLNYIGSISGFCMTSNIDVLFDEDLTFFEDYDLYLRILSRSIPFYSSSKSVYYYCVHESSLTNQIKRQHFTKINFAKDKILSSSLPKLSSKLYKFLARSQVMRLYFLHKKSRISFILMSLLIFILYPPFLFRFIQRLFLNLRF